jgi:hypothetical protein
VKQGEEARWGERGKERRGRCWVEVGCGRGEGGWVGSVGEMGFAGRAVGDGRGEKRAVARGGAGGGGAAWVTV